MIQDRNIATIDDELEVVYDLLNGATFNDFE